jgi:hypothetical protein
MEKITDKIDALPDGANYFSLEFFPPKTAMVSFPRVARDDQWRTRELHCYRHRVWR